MFCRIRVLLLRNNALVNVKGLEHLVSLGVLDLSYNLIASVSDVEALKSLTHLNTLALQGNPITLRANYRVDVLGVLADPRKVCLQIWSASSQSLARHHIIFQFPPAAGRFGWAVGNK